jgi:hypothetical protein
MSRRPSTPWRVVLIVEDDSDGRALKSLARASGLPALIDWLPANGIGNIKRRTGALIRLAMDRIEHGRGCVAVIVDRDRKDRKREEPHRTISRSCASQATAYIEAVEAVEAWLLADEGIVAWLGLAPRPRTDRIRDPKAVVARAFRKKTKRPYQRRRARMQLAAKATGVMSSRSPSWSQALAHLEECPIGGGP